MFLLFFVLNKNFCDPTKWEKGYHFLKSIYRQLSVTFNLTNNVMENSSYRKLFTLIIFSVFLHFWVKINELWRKGIVVLLRLQSFFWYFNEESQKPIRFSHLIEFSWKFIESVEFIPKLNTKQFGNENENNLSWGKTILRT